LTTNDDAVGGLRREGEVISPSSTPCAEMKNNFVGKFIYLSPDLKQLQLLHGKYKNCGCCNVSHSLP
jgi:hypothetical protein